MLSKLTHLLKRDRSGADDATDQPVAQAAEEILAAYTCEALSQKASWQVARPTDYETGRAIFDLPPHSQTFVVVAACKRLVTVSEILAAAGVVSSRDRNWQERCLLIRIIGDMLRRDLPFDETQVESLLDCIIGAEWETPGFGGGVIRAAERYVASKGMTIHIRAAIDRTIERVTSFTMYADQRKLLNRLKVLRIGQSPEIRLQLTRSEVWSTAVLHFLESIPDGRESVWARLIAHAATSTSAKPTKKWLKDVQSLLDQVTPNEFRTQFLMWLALVEKGGRNEPAVGGWREIRDGHLIMDAPNAQTLKGLVWCATLLPGDEEVTRALGRLGVACYRKIPNIGARSTAVANACVWALGTIPGREAVAQLSYIRAKSKYQAAQLGIAKALTAAAEREGVSTDDLEEMAVPTLGMSEVGHRTEQLGDYRAEFSVIGTHLVELRWTTDKGKTQKTVPANVKRDFADKLKELKSAQKELQKLLPAQRTRIESTYLRQKRWSLPAWRERYCDHPLVGTLARRLIWSFAPEGKNATSAMWHDGDLVDHQGKSLSDLGEHTSVELWHPVGAPVDDVVAWREWLDRHEVSQPFKQAHREIYLLTDAERNTETYSNRFAAHVIRQHQFNALCNERGWRYTLQGSWDSANTPFIDLPNWGLRAEFWVEPIEFDDASRAGIFSYLSTDQVRFYRTRENGLLQLAQVPPRAFSELMRDVDLFVGVCSVGNDPNWSDGGPDGRYRDYWQQASFGELSASANTRREVLSRLIPRLRIAESCSLDERHLIVRGSLRSYKIHLGSGNILMTPNDAYLCIVPGQGMAAQGAGKVYLPFEGDNLLSIILSKALMLADDTKITDPTIVSQIRSR